MRPHPFASLMGAALVVDLFKTKVHVVAELAEAGRGSVELLRVALERRAARQLDPTERLAVPCPGRWTI